MVLRKNYSGNAFHSLPHGIVASYFRIFKSDIEK